MEKCRNGGKIKTLARLPIFCFFVIMLVAPNIHAIERETQSLFDAVNATLKTTKMEVNGRYLTNLNVKGFVWVGKSAEFGEGARMIQAPGTAAIVDTEKTARFLVPIFSVMKIEGNPFVAIALKTDTWSLYRCTPKEAKLGNAFLRK